MTPIKINIPTKRLSNNRELRVYLPVYFFLSLVNLILKLRLTPAGWMGLWLITIKR